MQPLASLRVVGDSRSVLFFGDQLTVNRPIFRLFAATFAAATLLAAMPAPASAQGLFDFLFGNVRRSAPSSAPPVNSYADPSDPQRADPGERSAYVGGPSVAYCVRTCDGHFFPIQQNATRLAGRDLPVALPGGADQDLFRQRHRRRPFAGRQALCRSAECLRLSRQDRFELQLQRQDAVRARHISTSNAIRRLRQGDIVATHEGLAQVRGGRRGAANSRRSANPR